MPRRINDKGLELVKHFEGVHLKPYKCPAGVKTIGYGHTGPAADSRAITLAEAEQLLEQDLLEAAAYVETLVPGLGDNQFSALVSFTFNCGPGALKRSTLRKRVANGEDPYLVFPEELPRWNRGGGRILPGLVRRRKAEVLLAQEDGPQQRLIRTDKPAVEFVDRLNLEEFFHWYRGKRHQLDAVRLLADAIWEKAPDLLLPSADWVKAYRRSSNRLIELPVSYQYQLDSSVPGAGHRMCFSSTNAMAAEYLRPGVLKGAQKDDFFLDVVEGFGDTTSAEAQVAALKAVGVAAAFRQDGTSNKALELLRSGLPVPIGILHRGPLSNPSGFGHWILIVGVDLDSREWICHDPAGEIDLENGGFIDSSPLAGRFVRHDIDKLNRRWLVGGEGDGWFLELYQ